jgi:TonB family protein
MKKAALLALILLSVSVSGLFALPADLQSELSAKYEKQVLMLRHPVWSNSQKYDAAGNLIGHADPEPWTTHGGVEITKIRLAGDRLELEGTRCIYGYNPKQKTMLPVQLKDKTKVKVQIALPTPLSTMAEADAAIDRVFTRNDEELIDSVPDYWRPFLKTLHARAGKPDDEPAAKQKMVDLPTPREAAAGKEVAPMKIDGKLVKAPRARFTPEPSFTELARNKLRAEGVVVLSVIIDREGKVQRPIIIRPIGGGLDEQAIETVKLWKFDPATKDGEPVAVEMAIEVAFNLY